jgi:hypothetical protein
MVEVHEAVAGPAESAHDAFSTAIGARVKSHDVCNNVTSRLIDQLAISNAGSTSLCSTTASMRAMVSGLK